MFSPEIKEYIAVVPHEIDALMVLATPNEGSATVSMDGEPLPQVEHFEVGYRTLFVDVVAADGYHTQTYTVHVHRLPSSESHVLGMELSGGGVMEPPFDKDVKTYTYIVDDDVEETVVSLTLEDGMETALVNGGDPSLPQPLHVGANMVMVTTTAEDGSQSTYMVTVVRKHHSPPPPSPPSPSPPPNAPVAAMAHHPCTQWPIPH